MVDGSEHIRSDRNDWKSLTERMPHDLRAFYLFYTLPRICFFFFFSCISIFLYLFVCSVLWFRWRWMISCAASCSRAHVIVVRFSAVGAFVRSFQLIIIISCIDVLTWTARAIGFCGPSIEYKSSSSSSLGWFFVNSNKQSVFNGSLRPLDCYTLCWLPFITWNMTKRIP